MNERRFAILIASSQFSKESGLTNLRYPENDVDGLLDALASGDRGGFHELFPFKNRPRSEIVLKLNHVFGNADKNDLILIYYSGHGKQNKRGRLHLATVDTDQTALEATAISMAEILRFVEISATNKIIIILDCCYSGAVGSEFLRGGVDGELQGLSQSRGIFIMTASTGFQVAEEQEGDQHGLFTKHLIEGIKSGDADSDRNGLISMDELYRYVHDRVIAESSQKPMKWNIDVRGDLIIARSGKTLRRERSKQLRSIIYDLAAKEILPDDIVDKAREIIDLQPEHVTGILVDYDHLLDQLLDQSIRPHEFIRAWDRIPLSYGPILEGERARREDVYLECGGGKTECPELVQIAEMDKVEDGTINVLGPNITAPDLVDAESVGESEAENPSGGYPPELAVALNDLEKVLNEHRLWQNTDGKMGKRADLRGAVLKGVALRAANLMGAHLEKSDLGGADLSDADLHGAHLEGCNLSKANLSWAKLIKAKMEAADLSGAMLNAARLDEADLTGAILVDASLEDAHLKYAYLAKADLRNANLHKADLTMADLAGANLQGADLRNAVLRGTRFRGANLANVDMTGADLRDSDLER